MKNQKRAVRKQFFIILTIVVIMTGAFMVTNLFYTSSTTASASSTITSSTTTSANHDAANDTPIVLQSILHYATSSVIPQQSRNEIRVAFNVIQSLTPCNFLIFGLGHDSLMWSSFNPHGITLFIDDDVKRVRHFTTHVPSLRAYDVRYETRLTNAESLLASYRLNPHCLPPYITLKGNNRCQLALSRLPDEVYNTEWDVVIIDGPAGYFAGAPGRMGVIFSIAVMARARVRPGMTHVLVHDINRKVERTYANEFLCKKNLVTAEGRLWHFQIPSVVNVTTGTGRRSFC